MPVVAAVDVTAALKSRSYPALFISGIMNPPMAEVAATAEPEIAPNSMQEMTLTNASPPGTEPIRAFEKSITRCAMPPRAISWPDRTNSGIASSAKLLMPPAMRCAIVVTAGPKSIVVSIVASVDSPRAKAIGTPSTNKMTNVRISTAIVMSSPRIRGAFAVCSNCTGHRRNRIDADQHAGCRNDRVDQGYR